MDSAVLSQPQGFAGSVLRVPYTLALEMSGMSEASAGRSVPFREGFWEVL